MSEKSIESDVLNLVAEITGNRVEELSMNSSMHDTIRWTSLNHLEIVTQLETIIGKKLSLNEIVVISCIQDCVDIVKKYKNQ